MELPSACDRSSESSEDVADTPPATQRQTAAKQLQATKLRAKQLKEALCRRIMCLALIVLEPVVEELDAESMYNRWHPLHSSVVGTSGYVNANFDGLIKLFDDLLPGSVDWGSFSSAIWACKGLGNLGHISRSSNSRKSLAFTVPRRTGEYDEADVVRYLMPYGRSSAKDQPFPFAGLGLRDFQEEGVLNDVRAKLEVRIPIFLIGRNNRYVTMSKGWPSKSTAVSRCSLTRTCPSSRCHFTIITARKRMPLLRPRSLLLSLPPPRRSPRSSTLQVPSRSVTLLCHCCFYFFLHLACA
jgi:hypothetical protein